MDCYCDYEQPDIYKPTTPIASKTHWCYECGTTIQPGERYERVFGVWDGEPDTLKTCSHCLALREFVKAHVPCFCWRHGNAREDAIATAREYTDKAPGLLFGAYRREVRIIRERRKP